MLPIGLLIGTLAGGHSLLWVRILLRSYYRAAIGAKTSIGRYNCITARAGGIHRRFLLYDAGIQLTFGCRALKVCCRYSTLLRADSTIFVVSLAPEHSCRGTGVGLAVPTGVPVAFADGPLCCVVELLDTLHWKVAFCEVSGASEIVIEV